MKRRTSRYIKKMEKERGYVLATHRFLAERDPEFLRVYNALFERILTREGTLGLKTKELIVIALLCARGEYPAARLHVKRALDHGATAENVLEVLETAMLYTGAPTLMYGAESLIGHLDSG